MSREENETQDVKAVEAMLSSLAPSTGKLDRDRLMFLAGEAAALARLPLARAPLRRWAWPAAFSTMSAVAATLLALLVSQPEPTVIERIVHVPAGQPSAAGVPTKDFVSGAETPNRVEAQRQELPANDRAPTQGDYLRLRDQVLALGLDSWSPGRSAGAAAPADAPQSHRQMVERVLNSL
ncbi:MAG TPA: hypothetical protein VGX78_02190 [Pirellulales bacterium]|jgi:hypothetical protein|nr:hypothetical protein [Pirellulales bacterium]